MKMEQVVTLDGDVRVRYDKVGEGSPIILMHGWGCQASTLDSIARIAAEQHTVYNIDFPGFGASPEPTTVWGVEDYTAMLESFVRKLGIVRPILLGHSFGGRVGLLYSSRNDVEKLILVDAAGVKPLRTLKYLSLIHI